MRRETTAIGRDQFQAVAYYVGERIDLRSVTIGQRLASRPLTLALRDSQIAVLFRWGAVVFFDTDGGGIEKLLSEISPYVELPYSSPETEQVLVQIDSQAHEGLDGQTVMLRDGAVERLQVLASVLGKTVALSQYETDIAANFDRVEPFARDLEQSQHGAQKLRELLPHIGRALLTEHKLLGRVEVAEKPELLWEHPEIESLYARLEVDFELQERATMLDQKLELMVRHGSHCRRPFTTSP